MNNLRKRRWLLIILLMILLILTAITILYNKQEYEKKALTQYSGDYVMGDGMFMSCSLTVNSNKTFTLSRSSDTSDKKTTIHGNINIARNYMTLTPVDWTGPKMPCMIDNLVLIVWDERTYLLPDDGDQFSEFVLTRFCRNIREDVELQREKMGSVFPYIKTEDLELIKSNTQGTISNTMPSKFNGEPLCSE